MYPKALFLGLFYFSFMSDALIIRYADDNNFLYKGKTKEEVVSLMVSTLIKPQYDLKRTDLNYYVQI